MPDVTPLAGDPKYDGCRCSGSPAGKICDRGWEECVVLWGVSTPLGGFSTLVATAILPMKDMGARDLPLFRGGVTFAYGAVSAGAGESIPGENPVRVVWVKSETMPYESERLGGEGVPRWVPEMAGAHVPAVGGGAACWLSRSWRGRSVAWGRFIGDGI